MDQFTYFMIRVQVPIGNPETTVAGVIERLATGEKRSFRNGEELLRLVNDWAEIPVKTASES